MLAWRGTASGTLAHTHTNTLAANVRKRNARIRYCKSRHRRKNDEILKKNTSTSARELESKWKIEKRRGIKSDKKDSQENEKRKENSLQHEDEWKGMHGTKYWHTAIAAAAASWKQRTNVEIRMIANPWLNEEKRESIVGLASVALYTSAYVSRVGAQWLFFSSVVECKKILNWPTDWTSKERKKAKKHTYKEWNGIGMEFEAKKKSSSNQHHVHPQRKARI